jgi:hypothetical protein
VICAATPMVQQDLGNPPYARDTGSLSTRDDDTGPSRSTITVRASRGMYQVVP